MTDRPLRFEGVRIVAFTTTAAIVYGILHDLVTAHLCVEYFTIAHPPVFPTDSPLLLALGWGILATWWVGLMLGVALAGAARLGTRPRIGLAGLKRPVLLVMVAAALVAGAAGALGAALAAASAVPLPEMWRDAIPPERHVAFAAVAWAHTASYAAAAAGGILVLLLTLRRRKSAAPS